ncbi:Mitogen-activated protein kinase homolog MMK1 [Galdieria sulphuraria]|nr:Mitogen-activated protein kinase homolog MMK1 [Galdieria sulphuraria]
MTRQLGSGTYASVEKDKDIAIKRFFKIKGGTGSSGFRELAVNLAVNSHPYCIHLKEVRHLWDQSDPFEHLEIGYELAFAPLYKVAKKLRREQIREILFKIAVTLRDLHRANVIHGDLKEDNVLVMDKNDFTNIALCDFGLSMPFHCWHLDFECHPLPSVYRVPEYFKNRTYLLDGRIDVWAFGHLAFKLKTRVEIFQTELEARDYFESEESLKIRGTGWKQLDSLINFVFTKRPSSDELLTHSFFAKFLPQSFPISTPLFFDLSVKQIQNLILEAVENDKELPAAKNFVRKFCSVWCSYRVSPVSCEEVSYLFEDKLLTKLFKIEHFEQIWEALEKFAASPQNYKVKLVLTENFSLSNKQKQHLSLLPSFSIAKRTPDKVLEHPSQPRILRILKRSDLKFPGELPKIRMDDPLASASNLEVGDVVELQRKDNSIYYRECISVTASPAKSKEARIGAARSCLSWDEVLIDGTLEQLESLHLENDKRKKSFEKGDLCSNCGKLAAVFVSYQTRRADEGETLFLNCLSCGFVRKVA